MHRHRFIPHHMYILKFFQGIQSLANSIPIYTMLIKKNPYFLCLLVDVISNLSLMAEGLYVSNWHLPKPYLNSPVVNPCVNISHLALYLPSIWKGWVFFVFPLLLPHFPFQPFLPCPILFTLIESIVTFSCHSTFSINMFLLDCVTEILVVI